MSSDPTVDALMTFFQRDNPEGATQDDGNPDNPEKQEPKEKQGQPLILGKYKTEAEAQKGMMHLVQMANTERAARQKLETELQALKNQVTRQQSSDGSDPFEDLAEDSAIPADKFRKAIAAEAGRIAEQIAEQKVGPMAQALQAAMRVAEAEQAMLNEFGEQYYRDLPELRSFLAGNDEVRTLVEQAEQSGDPLLARKYAYAELQRAKERAGETDVQKRGQERTESVAKARVDATPLAGTRRNLGPATANVQSAQAPTREVLSKMLQEIRRGDYRTFDQLFVTPGLPSEEELRRMTGW